MYPGVGLLIIVRLLGSALECRYARMWYLAVSTGTVCPVTLETNRRTNLQIYSGKKLYMFWAVSLPILRSYPLYILHWHCVSCHIRNQQTH